VRCTPGWQRRRQRHWSATLLLPLPVSYFDWAAPRLTLSRVAQLGPLSSGTDGWRPGRGQV